MATSEERIDNALKIATDFGQTDGAHHKMWVIDRIVRALTGCQENGRTGDLEPSPEYERWIEEYKDGEIGPETYPWDEGIAP